MDNTNLFNYLPYELYLKFSNCNHSELFNLSLTCKRFNKQRLYRLYLSFLLINRLSGTFELYKNDIKYLGTLAYTINYNI